MIEKIQCLNDYMLQYELRPYLHKHGYFTIPAITGKDMNPFLWIWINKNNKEKLWEDIETFKLNEVKK